MAFNTQGAVTGASAGAVFGPIGAGVGAVAGGFLGGGGGAERPDIQALNFANFQTQRLLPRAFRQSSRGGIVDPFIRSGLQGIGQLIQNPGGLAPNVGAAIGPRLSIESERIGRNLRGQQSEAQGNLSRSGLGNTPFAAALNVALERAAARDQSVARRSALSETDQLRRQDLGQVFQLLQAQLSFLNSGRGIQSQQLGQQFQAANTDRAADAAGQAALLQALTKLNRPDWGGGRCCGRWLLRWWRRCRAARYTGVELR